MGTPRFELGTSALSGRRSNQLSYMPNVNDGMNYSTFLIFEKGGRGDFFKSNL